jgi:predicted outer membrane protein
MMGKAKLGSWWAAGAAVCLLISAGVAAQGLSGSDSPFNERGGPNQAVLTHLHQLNEQAIVDAGIAARRSTNASVQDFSKTLIDERSAVDTKLMHYAEQEGMNVDAIRAGTGAQSSGDLGRVNLTGAPAERFDHDFATKMVADRQAEYDAAQKAATLVRGPEIRALLRDLTPTLLREEAGAMALVDALPAPTDRVLLLPAEPPGVSRTNTGIDTHAGVAP